MFISSTCLKISVDSISFSTALGYAELTLFHSFCSCVHCNVVYSDVAALKSHIQGSHCEVFYKCPICPMAFKSAPSTHSHAYTQHPGIKIGEPK